LYNNVKVENAIFKTRSKGVIGGSALKPMLDDGVAADHQKTQPWRSGCAIEPFKK